MNITIKFFHSSSYKLPQNRKKPSSSTTFLHNKIIRYLKSYEIKLKHGVAMAKIGKSMKKKLTKKAKTYLLSLAGKR